MQLDIKYTFKKRVFHLWGGRPLIMLISLKTFGLDFSPASFLRPAGTAVQYGAQFVDIGKDLRSPSIASTSPGSFRQSPVSTL